MIAAMHIVCVAAYLHTSKMPEEEPAFPRQIPAKQTGRQTTAIAAILFFMQKPFLP
jgi:hypothetical protein